MLINLRRSHTQATSVHDADRVGVPRAGLVALCSFWPAFSTFFFIGSSTPYREYQLFFLKNKNHSEFNANPESTTHTPCPYRICRWSSVGAEGGAGDQIRVQTEANDRTRHRIGGGAHAWEDICSRPPFSNRQ